MVQKRDSKGRWATGPTAPPKTPVRRTAAPAAAPTTTSNIDAAHERFRTVVDGGGREVPRYSPNGAGQSSNSRAECGTQAGYNSHRRRNETACAECKAANSAAKKERKERQQDPNYVKPVRQPATCGTRSGYNKHLRNGEPPCPGCRSAYNAEQYVRDHAREADRGRPRDPWN